MAKLMAVTLLFGVLLAANASAAPNDLDEQALDLAKEPVEDPSDLEDEANIEDRDVDDNGMNQEEEEDDGDNGVGEEEEMRDDMGDDEPADMNEDEESLVD